MSLRRAKPDNGMQYNGTHTWGGHALKDPTDDKWVGYFSYMAGGCDLNVSYVAVGVVLLLWCYWVLGGMVLVCGQGKQPQREMSWPVGGGAACACACCRPSDWVGAGRARRPLPGPQFPYPRPHVNTTEPANDGALLTSMACLAPCGLTIRITICCCCAAVIVRGRGLLRGARRPGTRSR